MGRRERAKRPVEEDMGRPVVPLRSSSSSSDDEANQDLSLEIVERARRRQEEGSNMMERALEASKRRASSLVDLSSLDEGDAVSERWNGGDGVAPVVEASRKKKKKKKREQQEKEAADEKEGSVRGETEAADIAIVEDDKEVMETTDSVVTEVNDDISDNIVLRKLLRGPRYFDPGSSLLERCYNCGGEGHTAANCTAEKRRKPCFVCGMFGHNAHKCSQGQDCVICKRRGHRAKDCPDKHQNTSADSKICLRCGDLGHDMSSCRNGYPPHDLEKIQCYVCKSFGHFCCVNFIDSLPTEVSCYNCANSGHSGVGCAKPRGQACVVVSPTICYACGEEGHLARGCTRKSKPRELSDWRPRKPSTPSQPSKRKKDIMGSKSLPHNLGKGYKKKSMQSEDTRSMTVGKPKIKGRWIADDPVHLPSRIREVKPLKSPRTPKAHVELSYTYYKSAGSSYNSRVY